MPLKRYFGFGTQNCQNNMCWAHRDVSFNNSDHAILTTQKTENDISCPGVYSRCNQYSY